MFKEYYCTVVRPSVATMAIVSFSWGRGGGGVICKGGAELTCPAHPRLEESRAVWARDGGSCWTWRYLSLPACPALLHVFLWFQISWRPHRLQLSTYICPVLQLPKSHGLWWMSFGRLLNCPWNASLGHRFPSCSSPKNSFLRSRWSAIRTVYPAQRSCDFLSIVKTLGRWGPLCRVSSPDILCSVTLGGWLCESCQVFWRPSGRRSTFHSHTEV